MPCSTSDITVTRLSVQSAVSRLVFPNFLPSITCSGLKPQFGPNTSAGSLKYASQQSVMETTVDHARHGTVLTAGGAIEESSVKLMSKSSYSITADTPIPAMIDGPICLKTRLKAQAKRPNSNPAAHRIASTNQQPSSMGNPLNT